MDGQAFKLVLQSFLLAIFYHLFSDINTLHVPKDIIQQGTCSKWVVHWHHDISCIQQNSLKEDDQG